MPRVRQKPPATPAGIKKGVYLTDSVRLYRVVEVLERNVELEDCGKPDGCPQWMAVSEVLQKMKLVRRES